MRRVLIVLVLLATLASLLPGFWLAVALVIPWLNLYTWQIHEALGLSKAEYVLLQCGRLLRALGIALGTVMSIRFAIQRMRGYRSRITPPFVLALLVAAACGLHFEANSDKVPPWKFYLGFWEIPMLLWVLVGVVASRSSNIAVQETGAHDVRLSS
jgi:hypothetical protein